MPTRRQILTAAAALGLCPSLTLGAAPKRRRKRRLPLLPRVNGGINVQPLRRFDSVPDFTPPLIVPELVLLQMKAVYELGFRALRVTLSFNEFGPDFFGAIPYVRVARALGIDVLGIIDQFGHGFDLLRALSDESRRRRVLQAYATIFSSPVRPASRRVRELGRFAFQVLNEPAESRGLRPQDYVSHFLAPTYADLKSIAPQVPVLSAANVGRRAGLLRLRTMLASGLEGACDVVALHIYDGSLIDELHGLIAVPVAVTESGVAGADRHLDWVQQVFPRIRSSIDGVQEIYYFDLFDFGANRFRLIEIREASGGGFESAVESDGLVAYLREQVAVAAGDRPHATFEQLIPSLDPYLPTAEDFALVEQAR